MVFGIVQQHAGEITLRSIPGAGTTVRMTFPSVQVAAQRDRQPTPLEKTDLVARLIFDFLADEQTPKFMPGPKA